VVAGGLRRRLLGGGLAPRLRVIGLLGARQAVALGATAKTVGLRLDQRGRVTLHPHAHPLGKLHHLRVRHPELFGELVDPHVLRQNPISLSLPPARQGVQRQAVILSSP
jgi:hypothetical protein